MIAMQILQDYARGGWGRCYEKWKNEVFRNIYSLFVYDLTNLFLTLQRTAMKEFIIHNS